MKGEKEAIKKNGKPILEEEKSKFLYQAEKKLTKVAKTVKTFFVLKIARNLAGAEEKSTSLLKDLAIAKSVSHQLIAKLAVRSLMSPAEVIARYGKEEASLVFDECGRCETLASMLSDRKLKNEILDLKTTYSALASTYKEKHKPKVKDSDSDRVGSLRISTRKGNLSSEAIFLGSLADTDKYELKRQKKSESYRATRKQPERSVAHSRKQNKNVGKDSNFNASIYRSSAHNEEIRQKREHRNYGSTQTTQGKATQASQQKGTTTSEYALSKGEKKDTSNLNGKDEIHPSWAAKKRANASILVDAPAGKKIKFSD
jgi:hypothetical protein